jgi:hypothetical protein
MILEVLDRKTKERRRLKRGDMLSIDEQAGTFQVLCPDGALSWATFMDPVEAYQDIFPNNAFNAKLVQHILAENGAKSCEDDSRDGMHHYTIKSIRH